MKYIYLLFLFFSTWGVWAQEEIPKKRLFHPNYVTIQPVGISRGYIDDFYGDNHLCYSFGFGLERKIAKRFGIAFNQVWNKNQSSITPIGDIRYWNIQALVYFWSNIKSELSFGLALGRINTWNYDIHYHYKYKDGYNNLGFVVSYKYFINDYFFCKLSTAPSFGNAYMEYGSLHFGLRF